MHVSDDPIRTLHVTDDLAGEESLEDRIGGTDDRITVVPAVGAQAAREVLVEDGIDCVVADYDLPESTGVEFLRTVRERFPDLPFVLFPGEGCEAVASEAISAGVTDYVRRGIDDQYRVLAERIRDAVGPDATSDAGGLTERDLTDLVERTDDVLFVFDGDWDELLFVNSAYEAVWDGSITDLEGNPTSFLEHVHPNDRQRARESMAKLADGEADEVEYRIVTDDGIRWVHGESTPILDDDGDVSRIVGCVRDVTDRKRRERALQRERDRFRAVFEEAFDAMVIVDDDGQYVEVNESATDLFGLDEEALLGRSIAEFAPEDFDFETAWREFRNSNDERGTFPLVRADGEKRIVEYAATTDVASGRHLSVLRDVTDRKERRQELGERERRYRNLVENSPAPINLFDASGETVWGNDAVVELLGLDDREDLFGRSVFEFIHPDDHGIAESELENVIERGDVVGPTDFRLVRDDGEVRHVRVQTTAGWYEGERVGQAVVVDVTDRHRYEETLTTLHDRMRSMTRAESRQQVATVAVETLADLLDLDGAVFYEFDGDSDLVTVARSADVDEHVEDVPRSSADAGVLWAAFVDGEARFREDAADTALGEQLPFASALALPVSTHGLLVGGTTDRRSLTTTQRETARLVVENLDAALDRADTEAAIRDQERQLQRQNRALEQLNRLNEIIRDLNQALVRSSTRTDVLERVCERFATADQYAFAWIGVGDAADGTVVPEAWSGVDAEFVDHLRSTTADSPLQALLDDAWSDGEIRVAANVLDDDAWSEHRSDALSYGYRSIAAVPVVRGDRVECVLVVHAEDADTFDGEERRVLDELGETVGYALGNVRRTDAPDSERVEVKLEVRTDRLFTNRLTAETDLDVAVVDVVPDGGDVVEAFVRLDGATAETERRLQSFETVRSVRDLSSREADALYRLTVSTPPLVQRLRTADASLRTLRAENGTTTVTAVLAGDADVRTLIEDLQSVYPETELLARRADPDSAHATLREAILDQLTDRQLDALRAAHYGGLYEWPRETTSTTLAETRDVAASTFQYHLRKAEQKIVEALLDSSSGR
ncbi:MAG: PAS domain S-box protein [Haloarculaceae archaeon]